MDVELDLPLGFFTRIDDDEIQIAVRPSGTLGPRPEKNDLLGMDRLGDGLHYTLDHWIRDHTSTPGSSSRLDVQARVERRSHEPSNSSTSLLPNAWAARSNCLRVGLAFGFSRR